MTLQEVISKAASDPIFAMELQYKASKLAQGGPGSAEWDDVMFYFARDPQHLAELTALTPDASKPNPPNPPNPTTTLTTTTTITTVACFTTTTTTTTSNLCPLPM